MTDNIKIINLIDEKTLKYIEKNMSIIKVDRNKQKKPLKIQEDSTLQKKLREYANNILLDEITDTHIDLITSKKPKTENILRSLKGLDDINEQTAKDIIKILKMHVN